MHTSNEHCLVRSFLQRRSVLSCTLKCEHTPYKTSIRGLLSEAPINGLETPPVVALQRLLPLIGADEFLGE